MSTPTPCFNWCEKRLTKGGHRHPRNPYPTYALALVSIVLSVGCRPRQPQSVNTRTQNYYSSHWQTNLLSVHPVHSWVSSFTLRRINRLQEKQLIKATVGSYCMPNKSLNIQLCPLYVVFLLTPNNKKTELKCHIRFGSLLTNWISDCMDWFLVWLVCLLTKDRSSSSTSFIIFFLVNVNRKKDLKT